VKNLVAIACVSLTVMACGGGGASSGAAGSGGGGAGTTGGGATSGAAGATGAAGAAGMAGSMGTAGATGAGGTTGTAGATGSAGAGAAGAGGAGGGGGAGGAGSSAWRCPAGTFAAPTLVGLTPQRLAGVPPADLFAQGFSITEGPVWVGDTLFVSQFGSTSRPPTSRLLEIIAGAAATVANADFGSNGMATDGHGNLIVAVHKDGSIRRVSPASPAQSQIIAAQYLGKRFNAPNDVTIRSDGTVYFSDPDGYQSPTPSPQAKPRVYRVSPAGEVSVVDETIGQPNGVTLSLDEQTLFVDGDAGLFKFALMPDGSAGPKTPFGNSTAYTGSDGMGMDCAGDLYLAHNAEVVVVGPTGTELGRLAITGAQAATNVAFGGADHKTLFITTLDSKPGVYQVELGVPGMPF
jgi:gluconolactonase